MSKMTDFTAGAVCLVLGMTFDAISWGMFADVFSVVHWLTAVMIFMTAAIIGVVGACVTFAGNMVMGSLAIQALDDIVDDNFKY